MKKAAGACKCACWGMDTLALPSVAPPTTFGTEGAAQHCLFLDTRNRPNVLSAIAQPLPARPVPGKPSVVEQISVAIAGGRRTGRRTAQTPMNWRPMAWTRIAGNMHITLIEAGPRVLPALPERISWPVHKTLEKLGVTVMTNSAVSEVTADSLITSSAK